MRARGLVLLAVACWLHVGCATLLDGPTEVVEIRSVPEGARALVLPDDIEIVTPGRVDLQRKYVHTVLFELDGYQPATGYLDRDASATSYLNLLLGGLVGIFVDHSTGAIFRLIPNPLHVELVPIETPPPEPEDPAYSR